MTDDPRPDADGGTGSTGAAGDAPADPAAAALARAKAAAERAGHRPRRPARADGASRPDARRDTSPAGYTAAGPDPRDPRPVGDAVQGLVDHRQWRQPLSIGTIVAVWPRVVGPEVAAHTEPESVADGVLVVRADSTAWATQLRMLTTTIAARLAEELGNDGITGVSVRGPNAPSWSKGPRRVKGRGPRDTYG